VEEDSVFYHRIHSPVLLVEFDHQAGQAFPQYKEHYKDHIHVIVRTPTATITAEICCASITSGRGIIEFEIGIRKRAWLTGAGVCAAMDGPDPGNSFQRPRNSEPA
jgi:hypothetical protein